MISSLLKPELGLPNNVKKFKLKLTIHCWSLLLKRGTVWN